MDGCATCGADLPTISGRGRPRKYCDEHRRVDARRRYVRVDYAHRPCDACGATFKPANSRGRFCSAACRGRSADRPLACSLCGKPMWRSATSASAPICLDCRRERRETQLTKPAERWSCVDCGAECERPATRGHRPKFCEECRGSRGYWISNSRRREIYERDQWTCWLCEESVDPALVGSLDQWRPSLDHIVPRAFGGDHSDENLALAHWWCNAARSDGRYAPEVFRAGA